MDGRELHFRLFGINNQNFIMRDEETGTWWQQVSGEAIQGPLRGRKLVGIDHDEIAFELWKREKPFGRVLKPVAEHEEDYATEPWERQMKKVRTVTPVGKDDPLTPRTVVAGVTVRGVSRAYPFPMLRDQRLVLDRISGVPIVLLLGEDKKSIRVFERTVDGRVLELFVNRGEKPVKMFDAETGSEWDFAGTATAGPLRGKQLAKLRVLKEYWFDWKIYQPASSVYGAGAPETPPAS